MASVSMMASFVGGTAVADPAANNRCSLVVAKPAARAEGHDVATKDFDSKEEKRSNVRRAEMFAVAAAALTSVTASGKGIAFAEDGLKRGLPKARKTYASICVTLPTARICNKMA